MASYRFPYGPLSAGRRPVASDHLLVFLSSIDQEAHSCAQYGPIRISLTNLIFLKKNLLPPKTIQLFSPWKINR